MHVIKMKTKTSHYVEGRRDNSFSSKAVTCMISILYVLLLGSCISSFSLISYGGGWKKSQNEKSLFVRKLTSTDSEIEDAIRLGRSKFEKYYQFPLDDWQFRAGGAILMGHNVIVSAPTGAGKTVVGELALRSALDQDLEGIYTTPLKALSNQKFSEFRELFGNANVGLATGDISINRDAARLTVMTTEVYRNIAWRSSGKNYDDEENSKNDLRKNSIVVLDEFHYMGQPGRGGVWEESVITSPAHTQIIGLSATLSNAKELADWMTTVTGKYTELIEAPVARPVPLKYLFATREGLFPLFQNADAGPGSPLGLLGYRGDGIPPTPGLTKKKQNDEDSSFEGFPITKKLPKGLQINPALNRLSQRRVQKVNRMLERQKTTQSSFSSDESDDWYTSRKRGRGRGRGRGRNDNPMSQLSERRNRKEREHLTKKEMRKAVPSLTILIQRLKEKNLLPAIFFIFSRAGCDQTAQTISNAFKRPQDVDLDFQGDFQKSNKKESMLKGKSARQKKRTNKRSDKVGSRTNDVLQDIEGRSFRLSSNNVDENAFNSVLDANSISSETDFSISGSPLSPENWELYSSAGLLNFQEVEEVSEQVTIFNEENPEIALSDDIVEQLLFGLGRHHAGMLPAHKMLVENLFRKNLMKAVFATETLSAGINMPARTTVICSLAKRGGSGSMALLETSNLLQMAGRAGRRGMDTTGTCVLVATPFEGEDVAARILTDAIKPISSQFSPSYSLAVNLISRGNGRLDVAKELVSKSFANWSIQQNEETQKHPSKLDEVADVVVQMSEDEFLNTMVRTFDQIIQKRSANIDVVLLAHLSNTLKDRELLKKASKDFTSRKLAFELESTTLGCLEIEMKDSFGDEGSLFDEDEILQQVEEQQALVLKLKKNLDRHPFSSIASITNELMSGVIADGEDGKTLLKTFQSIKGMDDCSMLDAEDIARFAKSTVVVKRKLRKLKKSNQNMDPEALLLLETQRLEASKDSAWKDLLAITEVLIAFGCIVPVSGLPEGHSTADLEHGTFEVSPAGIDVGMLSFENSLWCFLAMGGTFDVTNASAEFDKMKEAMGIFDDNDQESNMFLEGEDNFDDNGRADVPSKAQQEAEALLYHLQELSPGEMAAYVSCLVTGDSVRSDRLDSISVFKRLGPRLQQSIQVLLDATERFTDVQRQYSVDEKACNCQFDLSHCEVVMAWANGCSWNEALEISGVAPGDLTRIIGRVLDAVRQFGALKFRPIRKSDLNPEEEGVVNPLSRGIHPEVRRLCREAAMEMNRYPVKDPFPFDVEADEVVSEVLENDPEDVEIDNDAGDKSHDYTHISVETEPSVDCDK